MRFCGIQNTPDTRYSTDAHLAQDTARSTTRSNGYGLPNPPTSHSSLNGSTTHSNAQRQARRGSRDDNQPNRHPQTRRTYLLRGMLFCPCGRRMYGNYRHHAAYYTCWPKNNNRGRPDNYAGHPTAIYLREAWLRSRKCPLASALHRSATSLDRQTLSPRQPFRRRLCHTFQPPQSSLSMTRTRCGRILTVCSHHHNAPQAE
jgi:hypothetical protein